MADEIKALLNENRSLRREVRLLRQRLEAFERSRWWRLHPRRLLVSGGADTSEPQVPRVEPSPGRADAVSKRFREEIVSRGTFTRDWFSHELPDLDPLALRLAESESSILEIGSFEGLSTCYFLWRLPGAHVTCVDTFLGSLGCVDPSSAELEATFDHNVALVDASRVRKIVGDSRRVLLDLVDEGAEFDLVYVDGSHYALDVVVDAALSWRLLADGGTMVFDDYGWNNEGDDPLLRPGLAIDAMLGLVAGKYELLHQGAQLALRKTA